MQIPVTAYPELAPKHLNFFVITKAYVYIRDEMFLSDRTYTISAIHNLTELPYKRIQVNLDVPIPASFYFSYAHLIFDTSCNYKKSNMIIFNI